MATNKRSATMAFRPFKGIVMRFFLLFFVMAMMMRSFSKANVINDVNNMLRDTTSKTTTSSSTESGKFLKDLENFKITNPHAPYHSHRYAEFGQVNEENAFLRPVLPNSNKNSHVIEATLNGNAIMKADISHGKAIKVDNHQESSGELLRFVNDDEDVEDVENVEDFQLMNNNEDNSIEDSINIVDNHSDNDNYQQNDYEQIKINFQTKQQQNGIVKRNQESSQKPLQKKNARENSNNYDDSNDEDLNASKVNSKDADINNNEEHQSKSVDDQVRLLSKQLNALMTRRREDYEILEQNLRKSLRIASTTENTDLDIRNELEQLRHEVKSLRDNHLNGNKERLTVEWLQQSVSEIRKQLVELQQIASNTARDVNRHTENYEDLATIRSDFQQLKLQLAGLKERQEQNSVYVQELREELLQQEEDFQRLLHNNNYNVKHADVKDKTKNPQNIEMNTELLADHRRRHAHFQTEQLRDLQVAQHNLKRQLNELKFHRIADRVRNIEIEQHRVAGANFNLSKQIASFDKMHSSMLELLEDVEGLQNQMDKNIPELRHEISKLEFSSAQVQSEQNLLHEEGKNTARSVQAMAVSVSTLQEQRDELKNQMGKMDHLATNVDRLQTLIDNVQKNLKHHRHNSDKKMSFNKIQSKSLKLADGRDNKVKDGLEAEGGEGDLKQVATPIEEAEILVSKLENVEQQYESLIDKLPRDCSEITTKAAGIFLIAPNGQHRPIMTHCSENGWTTIQRRYDGSADFNRTWEDYAKGFGVPAGEYWIGNEQLHQLTLNNCTSLRIEMQDIYDNTWEAVYDSFYISSRSEGYRLHISGYKGNASDALSYQQDMQFSAIDDDRDISQTHCAANYEGGWWFSHCQHANLNGRYNLGLTWFDASRNEWIAVKSSQMSIKRKSVAICEYVATTNIATSTPSTTIVSSVVSSIVSATIPTTNSVV